MFSFLSVLSVVAIVAPCLGTDGGASSKIYNGYTAMSNENPWLVWISKNGELLCHGSLIKRNWVLTTASCVGHGKPKKYRLHIGDLRRGMSDGEQTNRGQLIILHENYTQGVPDYDVALVKLKRPADISRKWIMPVPKLASRRNEGAALDRDGIKCRIAGWGSDLRNDKWRQVYRLQQKFVDIDRSWTCDSIGGFNNVTSLCYKGSPCHGDEGAPIICYINRNWVQVGMHVYHKSDGACAGGENLSLSVCYFEKWIKNTIEQN